MRVLVGVKRVIDYSVKVRLAANNKIQTSGIKYSTNPFCEIAVEEAIVLRQNNFASSTTAVSIGGKSAVDSLRSCLAMGIDNAIHIETDPSIDVDLLLQPSTVSLILAHIAKKEKSDLVILGKQAIDDDNNQTAQMTAHHLKCAQITNASKITPNKTADKVDGLSVVREVDGGSQLLSCSLPAVVSADLRLNTPRYATLPNIMKAKKKPIQTFSLVDIAKEIAAAQTNEKLDLLTPRLKIVKLAEPETRKAGIKVGSVAELVDKLKNEAKLL